MSELGWLYANKPDGARALLSTVAGSMITVAGVTFSMTILTVSFAAGQIGPRLMSNFMRDRGNQVTLGTFIATFLYCLMVLRTVRNADEADPAVDQVLGAFVPHISILLALALAVLSVGVLIYFIHHVPESIDVSRVVAKVAKDLNSMVDHEFPTQMGEGRSGQAFRGGWGFEETPQFGEAASVAAETDGYLRALDEEELMRLAQDHDLLVRMQYRPGDFVHRGKVLLHAWPSSRVDAQTVKDLRSVFVFGGERSRNQNMFFLVDELVEIIARALSPGVNDPFTAISCLDWLEGVLANLARRPAPDPVRFDQEGNPRVVTYPVTFVSVTDRICHQVLPYVSADRNAALRMMKMLAEVAVDLPPGSRRDALMRHALQLRDAARESLALEVDREAVDARYRQTLQALADTTSLLPFRDCQGWLGGSA